jgi:AcrR family transcriptional regulator
VLGASDGWCASSTLRRPSAAQGPGASRRAILDAVREEFGEHGFPDARVVRIAAAGVSHQLITYHFGGKQGLYDAVNADWRTRSKEMIGGPEPYAELIQSYVHEGYREQQWARMVVREELDGGPVRLGWWIDRGELSCARCHALCVSIA